MANSSVTAPRLEARDLVVRFEGLTAIRNLDLVLHQGQVCGLIGPNGAGKTTLVNVLTGFQTPSAGQVILAGRRVSGLPPERIARQGIMRTFQNARLFPSFTVLDNLKAYAIGLGAGERAAETRSREILDWMGLADLADRGADSLSYGAERRVGIARALAGNPKFLLLDEPAAGMNEAECDVLMASIRHIPERFGCGIMLIEHNMRVVMNTCDRICVIDFGAKIAEGLPEDIRRDQAVLDAYLGSEVA